jgi:hypothetical protein
MILSLTLFHRVISTMNNLNLLLMLRFSTFPAVLIEWLCRQPAIVKRCTMVTRLHLQNPFVCWYYLGLCFHFTVFCGWVNISSSNQLLHLKVMTRLLKSYTWTADFIFSTSPYLANLVLNNRSRYGSGDMTAGVVMTNVHRV